MTQLLTPVIGREQTSVECRHLLDARGHWLIGTARIEGGAVSKFHFEEAGDSPAGHGATHYLVEGVPKEVHFHGVGDQDFSRGMDLARTQALLRREGVEGVPTVFLARSDLDGFCRLAREYDRMRRDGEVPNVVGLALEGPLLYHSGGTPPARRWQPDRGEWSRLLACGPLGLRYTVLSPDAVPTGELDWIVSGLIDGGVRVALGHFAKDDPKESARRIEQVLRIAERRAPGAGMVLTDHLYNDMPRNFKHAWRGPAERAARDRELAQLRVDEWHFGNLEYRLGAVPAALMRAARDGRLSLCLNFDGEHVDPVICRRTVELLGARAVVAMTDRTETTTLGEQELYQTAEESLWYQVAGVVAAGSRGIWTQMAQARSLGICEADIWEMACFGPARALGLPQAAGSPLSLVTADGAARDRRGSLMASGSLVN
jgi:N-acetylglucosamine-6-phosphate deacetylase